MAKPIPLEFAPRDPRKEAIARLESAPVEHAEAILSALELLQDMHDQRMLELLRGLVSSQGKILEMLTEAAKQPDAIRGIRNLVLLAKTFGSIDPDVMRDLAEAVPNALLEAKAEAANPPGLWALYKQFRRKNSRRGLAVVNRLLENWGKHLAGEGDQNSK